MSLEDENTRYALSEYRKLWKQDEGLYEKVNELLDRWGVTHHELLEVCDEALAFIQELRRLDEAGAIDLLTNTDLFDEDYVSRQ